MTFRGVGTYSTKLSQIHVPVSWQGPNQQLPVTDKINIKMGSWFTYFHSLQSGTKVGREQEQLNGDFGTTHIQGLLNAMR